MGLRDLYSGKSKTEIIVEKNSRQQVLFQWIKILCWLLLFLGICYIVKGIAEGISLQPEIMEPNNPLLVALVATLFMTVFKAFMYIITVSTVLWVIVGVINVFL